MKIGPYETGKVYQGDCLDLMNEMDDDAVSVVITDPPYGVNYKGADWDAKIPFWFNDAWRLSGQIMFTTAPTTQWDYPRPDWVAAWTRPGSLARAARGGVNHWSPILIYGKNPFPVDLIRLPNCQHYSGQDIVHPTPKPIALLRWMVSHADEGVILDPFAGSGTTGVACAELGREFLGFEIDPDYCKLANERIEAAKKGITLAKEKAGQGTLFTK